MAADQQITISRFIEKETGALRYPSFYASAGYAYSRSQSAGGLALLNLNYGPYAGITLNVPIFNGGIYRKQQQIAGINIQKCAADAGYAGTELYFECRQELAGIY